MIYKIINKFSVYIDPSKFSNGNLFSIYKSTEGRNIKLFNLFYISLLGYNAYQYQQDKENSKYAINDLTASSYQSGMENTIILMSALGLGMTFFYWKTNKTLFNMWLSSNGQQIIMDSYTLFGLNSKTLALDINNFRGFCYFIHPSLRIPMFRYKTGETIKTMFFKHQYVIDEAVIKSVINGQDIIIRAKGMEKELSNSQKKKYGI